MKALIISQSSTEGMNYRLAEDCIKYIENLVDNIKCKYTNSIDVTSEVISESDRILMIVPEWNGSFPFMFKQMIDNSGYPSTFSNKKILLIGTSDSTFGNIMGITQLQHILEWCGSDVYKKRLCVPNIRNLSNQSSKETKDRINKTIKDFFNEK